MISITAGATPEKQLGSDKAPHPTYVPSTNFGFERTANSNYRYAGRICIRGQTGADLGWTEDESGIESFGWSKD